jgi:thiol-disulfide isomerase/thioredoxin
MAGAQYIEGMNSRQLARFSRPVIFMAALLALSPLAASAQAFDRRALAFKAVDIQGKQVNFPADYRGHLVLLDFWATWCGPCVAEVPGLVRAYNKYRAQGLEVLGVSLDQAQALDRLHAFTEKMGMTWRQIYDGKYWQARIAQFYRIDSIPRSFLVDGDSGAILATGDALRGASLEPTIAKALAAKK